MKLLPVHHSTIPKLEHPPFDIKMIYGIDDKNIACDFVLSNKTVHNVSLQFSLTKREGRWNVPVYTPVVNHFTETSMDDRLPLLGSPAGECGIASSMSCCPTIVMNQYDADNAIDVCRRKLSGSDIKKAMQNLYVSKACMNSEDVDKNFDEYELKRKERLASGKINVFHGGSLEPKRHIPEMYKAVKKLWEGGAKISFVNVTPAAENPWDVAEWFDFRPKTFHKEFLSYLGDGDIFWMAADYEGTGISSMEAVRSGMIPIAIKNTWIVDRLGEDYPFYASITQIPKMLSYMMKNFEAIKKEWQPKLIDRMSMWTTPEVAKDFVEIAKKIIENARKKNDYWITKNFAYPFLVKALSDNPEVVSIKEVFERMTKSTDKGLDFKWVTLPAIRLMMISLGYEDDCNSEEFMMRKIK